MGWPRRKLGDVCGFQNGFAFKSKLFTEVGVPILRISNIQSGSIDLNKIAYTDPRTYKENLEKYRVVDGDLLIAMSGATTGKIGINKTGLEFLLNQRVGKFLPSSMLDKKYLYYYLSTKVDEHLEISAGAAQPNLSTEQIKGMTMPLPPIPEQKRIVAILDQVFADIEQARAKTEQNLRNARELFESYLQQVFNQRGEGWEIKRVSEVADTCLGKMLDKRKNKGHPKPYLRNLNVQWFDINVTDVLEMRFENSEHDRYSVKKGDLLICEGGYPGRAAIWEQNEAIYFQKALHRVRFHQAIYNWWFLYFLYISDSNGSLKINFTGAGIQHFTGKALKQFLLPIPKESQTETFVKKFDFLFDKVQRLEKVYQKKLLLIDELKKSILQQAFTGQLTQSHKQPTTQHGVAI